MTEPQQADAEMDPTVEALFGHIHQLFATMSPAAAERLHAMADREQRDRDIETEERDWYRISRSATWWNAMYARLVCDGLSDSRVRVIQERSASAWTTLASILKYAYALGIREGMRVQVREQDRVSEANQIAFRELEEAKDDERKTPNDL